jgi:phosphatidyl-myo-inositol dimannoside synthase
LKIHFLYLTAFSRTGGIEKFNKAFFKALTEIGEKKNFNFRIISAYDTDKDSRYLVKDYFRGFGGKRIKFTLFSILDAKNSDVVFLGHINLSLVALLLKIINPGIKVVLIAHGTEVWENLSFIKKLLFKRCYKIFAVSSYTKKRIEENQKLKPGKIIVFYNTLDPLFNIPANFEKPVYILQRYGINPEEKVILTVSRIRFNEKYKGYDKVIETWGCPKSKER